jgi:S1-C subfamily serine protease
MGWMFCLMVSFLFANNNYEGFSTSEPMDPLKKVWNSTARIKNAGNFDKVDKATGDILTLASSFEGSGVLVQKIAPNKGLVVTNAHVASCPPRKQCRLHLSFTINGSRLSATKAKVIREVLTQDLALIEFTMREENLAMVPVATLTSAYDVAVSKPVFAIGYPKVSLRKKQDWQNQVPDNYNSMLKRISRGRSVQVLPLVVASSYQYSDGRIFRLQVGPMIIHSADILSGNSGGPLVNAEGKVLGLSSGIQFGKGEKHNRYCYINGTATNEDIGCSYFAISSDAIATNFGLAIP